MFTSECFRLLGDFGGKKYDKNNDNDIKVRKELTNFYIITKEWAKKLQEKKFPDGYIKINMSSINMAQNFSPYQWARIYPKKNSRIEVAYTIDIVASEGFTVKIDTVHQSGKVRKAYESLLDDPQIIIKRTLSENDGLKLSVEELVNWSIKSIDEFNLTFEQVLEKINIAAPIMENNINSSVEGEVLPIIPSQHPLNQILFGPPGTGKTYNTVNKAIEIANPYFFIDKDTEQKKTRERKEIKKEFDRLMNEGQIVFTTFHQSMCYEDFIEGIKPETTPDDKRVIYDVKPGIFKNLCQAATTPNLIGFNAAYEQLTKELSEIEDAESDVIEVKTIEIKTPTGKPFSISLNSNNNLSLHTGPNKIKQGTLTKENIQAQINGDVKFIGWNGYFEGVCNYLKENYNYSSTTEKTAKNFVLIIDEINRGNVSQIFGELITLIEDDKRVGCPEALEVTLPYSKVKFGVPSNLYIIGTMNTADRSVEALDAALRRRFSFVEMQPDSTKIKTIDKLVNKGIDLSELLTTINERIEKLLDKDHQIGHSYFINIEDLDGLKLAFKNKIIPLLQEYFFGDYGKIGLILGEDFFEQGVSLPAGKEAFAKFSYSDVSDFSERVIYRFKNVVNITNEEFVAAINSLLNKKTDVE